MTQNYVTVSIKLCLDVWNYEYIILYKFIKFDWIQFISLDMPWLILSYRQKFLDGHKSTNYVHNKYRRGTRKSKDK